ncbi:4Fe-4S dicluster domain-containing protein [Vibrio diazotrophicus]|uniref:4Fe-4S dicluster domain-containing protein n=1 Tax=Vibrio diazotrophicus TaxID=685 RepID=UPI000C9DC33D|nr:4Fe-4S binding protein [Vibrio diazotrophicus]PNH90596.1 (Fe-S)-binding protein [Vibrio diazotrophicus]
MLKQYLQQSTSQNGIARYSAIENTVELSNLIPPTVSYESSGDTLIIGPTSLIERIAEQLPQVHSVSLLSIDGEKGKEANIYFADSVQISGYLGSFDVLVQNHGVTTSLSKVAIGKDSFDIILDMSLNGVMTEEVPVPGYFPVGRGYPKLADALEQIPNLVGTFDKPKYFRLDTDLCAHSSRGVKGCERCVDACPAGALSSEGSDKTGHRIEINPYLCQGVGTCATACPTEAIHYALPTPKETQKFIERLLKNYFQAGGEKPVVLICSSEHETYNLMALKALPENVIPVTVDELPSIGIDTWFAALTNGATQVLFAASRRMPKTIQRILEQEVATAQTLLSQLGLAKETINILYLESLREGAPSLITDDLQLRLGELEGDKRARLFTSLDALAEQFNIEKVAQPLEASSVYGAIECSTKDCTLCMGCVAVCPTRALHHEGDIPGIKFVEQDCVQCGLCIKACPENALTSVKQMNWDKAARQSAITLHQEEPAKCLRCHKPFAPQSMITMLQNKLQGHSHFATAEALNRIAMCEDCRVIDVFESMANDPEQQLRY